MKIQERILAMDQQTLAVRLALEYLSEGELAKVEIREGSVILGIVSSPDSIGNVPDPACVRSHLPAGRKPTIQELEAALKACKKRA